MTNQSPACWGRDFALAAKKTMTEIFEEILEERGAKEAPGDDGMVEDKADGRSDGD